MSQEIAVLINDVNSLEVKANQLEITDEKSMVEASSILGVIASTKKRFEDVRKFFTKPLNDHVRNIKDQFKAQAEPLNRADKIIRTKVLKYNQEQERKRKEEEERLRKLVEEANKKAQEYAEITGEEHIPIVIPQTEVKQSVKSNLGTTTIKKVWTFEVVNENEIPREYLVLDVKKVNEAIKAGVREIKGLKIYEKDEIAVRGKM